MEEKATAKKRFRLRFVRIFLWIIVAWFAVFLALVMVLNIPAVQTYITSIVSQSLSKKMNSEVSVGAVKIAFPKTVQLNKIFLATPQADTLLFVEEISINADLMNLLRNKILVRNLTITGLVGDIRRIPQSDKFNFQFVIDAFASGDTVPEPDINPAKPWVFDVRDINLLNIRCSYFDEIAGINARLQLGKLALEVEHLDPYKMDFRIAGINLSNTTAFVEQWNVESPPDKNGITADRDISAEAQTAGFPIICLDMLCLENLHLRYLNKDTRQDYSLDFGLLRLNPKKIDLNKYHLDLGEFFLMNSSLIAEMAISTENAVNTPDKNALPEDIIDESKPGALFPDWNITMDNLIIDDVDLKFDDVMAPKTSAGIDYGHLFLNNLNIETGKISLSSHGLSAEIKNIGFIEQCGFIIKKLSGDIEFSDTISGIKNLGMITPNSSISGDVRLGYASVEALQKDLGQTDVWLELKKLKASPRDIFFFAPQLTADSLMGRFSNETIIAKATATGKINNLKFENLDLWLFDFTKLKAHGLISGLPETSTPAFDIVVDALSTNLSDFEIFTDSLIPKNITLPETMLLKGAAKGNFNDLTAEIIATSAFGDISATAFYQKHDSLSRDTFNIVFEVKDLMAGQILSDTLYRNFNGSGKIAGTGAGNDSIAAVADLIIEEAGFNNYRYHNIEAAAQINGQVYSAKLKSADPNIHLDASAKADLRKRSQKFTTQINLESLNPAALNFINDSLLISSSISANASYTSNDTMDVNIKISDTRLKKDKLIVPVNLLEINASAFHKQLKAELISDFLDVSINGDAEPDKLQAVMQAMIKKYLGTTDSVGVLPGTHIAFNLNTHLPKNIKKLISEDFDISDITNFNGSYNSDNNELSADMQLNNLIYTGLSLDTLTLKINGKNDDLLIDFNCRKIAFDTIKIENFSISEAIKNGKILSEIKIADTSQIPRYQFKNEISITDSGFQISFLPDGLFLDSRKWTVEKENFLNFTNDEITAHNFVFTNLDESFGIKTKQNNREVEFRNFDLKNILNIVEFTRKGHFLGGRLDGEIELPGAGNHQKLFAGLKIDSLFVLDTLAGSFSLGAEYDSSMLNINVLLENNENKISVAGNILSLQGDPEFDLEILLDLKNLNLLEKFSLGTVSEMSGKINGKMAIKGSAKNPDVIGEVGFNETALKINSLNFFTRLHDEKLTFDAGGLRLDNFVIQDSLNHKLTINGSILTENYSDYNFDLRIDTKNFQPINSTSANNKTFFGKLNIDTDLKIKGNQNSPVIDASIRINKDSELTYALPGSELSLITPEGIVHFVDPSVENDSMVVAGSINYITDSIISTISGIDLTTNLEIDQDARFTLIIDPKSGDYLTIGGSAILSIALDRAGNQTMTGIYEVKTGVYQLSFYGLVKKSFTLKQGSNISWSGKPMDAALDITAEYVVTTSSVSLIANETNSMSDAEKNIYKQRLPYTVLLNIDGFLAQPEISFNITLPDKYMINYPQVASKLSQLNTPEMESERNKQVFGLLVTGSFIADNPLASTGTSTSSIATTAAINSVNGILADQLNNVSSKYVKGVDLNFGLNSYEDYSGTTSEMRTELDVKVSKKLLNDRLTVEAQGSFDVEGSKSNNSAQTSQGMWGEFAVIYSLDAEGQYKLRAYRENAYDFFDGEIAYSGMAFIFEKEFNSLKRKSKQEREDRKKARQHSKEGLKPDEPKTSNE